MSCESLCLPQTGCLVFTPDTSSNLQSCAVMCFDIDVGLICTIRHLRKQHCHCFAGIAANRLNHANTMLAPPGDLSASRHSLYANTSTSRPCKSPNSLMSPCQVVALSMCSVCCLQLPSQFLHVELPALDLIHCMSLNAGVFRCHAMICGVRLTARRGQGQPSSVHEWLHLIWAWWLGCFHAFLASTVKLMLLHACPGPRGTRADH